MNHFILLALCFLAVEILIRSNCLALISSIIKLSRKSIFIILNKNISDHWKENILPAYSLKMIKASIQMLLMFILISGIFYTIGNFFSGFFAFVFSLNGFIESTLFIYSFIFFRKLFAR